MNRYKYHHKYYLENREKYIERSKANYKKNRERILASCKEQYKERRTEIIKKSFEYYETHKDDPAWRVEKNKRVQNHRLNTIIRHDGQDYLKNVEKAPCLDKLYCPLCERKTIVHYHHWDDTKPEDGLWICNSCHIIIHHILKHHNLKVVICRGIKELLKQRQSPVPKAL